MGYDRKSVGSYTLRFYMMHDVSSTSVDAPRTNVRGHCRESAITDSGKLLVRNQVKLV